MIDNIYDLLDNVGGNVGGRGVLHFISLDETRFSGLFCSSFTRKKCRALSSLL